MDNFTDDFMLQGEMRKYHETRVEEDLTAYVIGQAFLDYTKQTGVMQDILAAVDGKALQILEEIRCALDDDALDDPECFKRIEAILTVLENHGITSLRHDW